MLIKIKLWSLKKIWLQLRDLNPWPLGYEPNELNRCSKLRYKWGSWRESNPQIIAPQATVLNHFTTTTKKVFKKFGDLQNKSNGCPCRIRTYGWRNQNPLPFRLAKGQNGGGGGIRTPELERSGLQPPAFGRFATPPKLRLLIYYI